VYREEQNEEFICVNQFDIWRYCTKK